MWKISKILTLLGTANRSHMIMVYHIISTSEQVIDNQFANRWNSAMTFAASQLVGLRKAERTGWVQVAGASSGSVTQCSMGIKPLKFQYIYIRNHVYYIYYYSLTLHFVEYTKFNQIYLFQNLSTWFGRQATHRVCSWVPVAAVTALETDWIVYNLLAWNSSYKEVDQW